MQLYGQNEHMKRYYEIPFIPLLGIQMGIVLITIKVAIKYSVEPLTLLL